MQQQMNKGMQFSKAIKRNVDTRYKNTNKQKKNCISKGPLNATERKRERESLMKLKKRQKIAYKTKGFKQKKKPE